MIYTVTLNTALDRTIEVPHLTIGTVLQGRTICEQPAGKGVNLSRCLATLGVPSIVCGFVGAQEAHLFRLSFVGTKARVRLIPVGGRTRRDTTLIDPIAHTDTHIRESGYSLGRKDVAALRAELAAHAKPGDIVVFCGSLPPGLTPDTFASLLRHAKRLGCKVVVDTSDQALRVACRIHPYLIKPNRAELESLLPKDYQLGPQVEDIISAARVFIKEVENIAISLGKHGAILITPQAAYHATCPLPPVKVKSTVGCGDAFLAGLIAGLHASRSRTRCTLPIPASPIESLRLAVACGAACALTPVAGLIHLDDVARLLPLAQVRPV